MHSISEMPNAHLLVVLLLSVSQEAAKGDRQQQQLQFLMNFPSPISYNLPMQSITKNAMIIVLPYHKLHYGDCQWPTFALCLYEDCNVTYLDTLFNTNKDHNTNDALTGRTPIFQTSNWYQTNIE